MTRKTVSGLALAATMLAAAPVMAQNYPTGPVTVVVPFGAGGGTDNLVRSLQTAVQEALGQAMVVDNRPGAGSIVGTDIVAKAAPDGYTLLAVDSAILVNPALHDNMPYDTLADLVPVSLLATAPVILVGHPGAEADSFEELVAVAKDRPGELAFASGGSGSSPHLALELMQLQADVDVIHVPYQGSGPAATDLVGGHVDYMFNGISTVRAHIESGALKVLAVTSDERHPVIPDVPTFAELGYPGINPMSIWGVWAPAGTPDEIVEQLAEAFAAAVSEPSVQETLTNLGYFTVGSSPREYAERVATEMAQWAEVVAAGDFTAD